MITAFTKLQTATINLVVSVFLSVRPAGRPSVSVCMEQLGSEWMDFYEI
jgi:hypothetical protein